jgi:phage gp29-like protein
MKTVSQISEIRVKNSMRARFNPIKTLTPDSLSQMLDAFSAGYLKSAALTWDAIERRDDVIQGVASKRKKSISRLNWEILSADSSSLASEQKYVLEYFYNNLSATSACDGNENGGISLLVRQMMDAVGKKYAVHEVVFEPREIQKDGTHLHSPEHLSSTRPANTAPSMLLTATFRFVPLWFFENRDGKLKFLPDEGATSGIPLESGSWLVTTGDGIMEACSIAYLFKHLPLRDWLVYCERNGMPGVKGVTDAAPNTEQWEAARNAVEDFGAEFSALMSKGTTIEAIDLSTRGELPYPRLVDRMDRAIAALWRGSDLATMSRESGVGASMQADESAILEEADAAMISESLNSQVDKFVLKYIFGDAPAKAYIKFVPNAKHNVSQELNVYRELHRMGVPLSMSDVREKFNLQTPSDGEPMLPPASEAERLAIGEIRTPSGGESTLPQASMAEKSITKENQ